MDLESLRAFVAVARAGGFTAAARAAKTTQPSLSRRVQQLEKVVGARLVGRSARGVVLTRAGERFLVHAERTLRSFEAGVTEIAELAEHPHGNVAIGVMPSVGAQLLPEAIAQFVARFPDVVLRVREGFPSVLEDQLARGELDLAVFNLPVRRGELSARKLWQEEYLLVVPEKHRLAGEKRVDLSAIAGEPMVVIPNVPATEAMIAACEERGVPAKIVVETETLESVRRLVLRGVGVALLPRMLATESIRGLHAIELARGALRRQVALVHRGDEYLTAASRALRTILVEVAKKRA